MCAWDVGCGRHAVVDPAYPPERQIIYLTVAKPKGFITLQRAGELQAEVSKVCFFGSRSPDVTDTPPDRVASARVVCLVHDGAPSIQFIADNLNILCHIPALAADDDGILAGVSTVNPCIEIGPDDIGTLSFTSGSTGIPKGATVGAQPARSKKGRRGGSH